MLQGGYVYYIYMRPSNACFNLQVQPGAVRMQAVVVTGTPHDPNQTLGLKGIKRVKEWYQILPN